MGHWSSQFRKGLLELCILALVRDKRDHGYRLVGRLALVEGLEASESTVYPILSRLKSDGLVTARKEASSGGPPRQVYEITEAGRQRLERLAEYWRRLTESVYAVLRNSSERSEG